MDTENNNTLAQNQQNDGDSLLKNDNTTNNSQGVVIAPISAEMKECYLAYAMSVIVSRAIPDVRDGLKPVHRRIMYAMNEMGCNYNRQPKKSSRIVGEVMGK